MQKGFVSLLGSSGRGSANPAPEKNRRLPEPASVHQAVDSAFSVPRGGRGLEAKASNGSQTIIVHNVKARGAHRRRREPVPWAVLGLGARQALRLVG